MMAPLADEVLRLYFTQLIPAPHTLWAEEQLSVREAAGCWVPTSPNTYTADIINGNMGKASFCIVCVKLCILYHKPDIVLPLIPATENT